VLVPPLVDPCCTVPLALVDPRCTADPPLLTCEPPLLTCEPLLPRETPALDDPPLDDPPLDDDPPPELPPLDDPPPELPPDCVCWADEAAGVPSKNIGTSTAIAKPDHAGNIRFMAYPLLPSVIATRLPDGLIRIP
jgi:hypothetical protein